MGFENLSATNSSYAFKALNVNAKTLINTAKKAAEIGNYGVARSLVILGSEEFTKGAILYLRGIGVKVLDKEEISQALRLHKKRHEVVMLFKLLKPLEALMMFKKYKPAPSVKPTLGGWLSFHYSQGKSILKAASDVVEDLDWWEKANDYKNDGIYVDYMDGLKLPNSITKGDFELALAKVNELMRRFKVYKIVFERSSSVKEKKDIVEMINQGLLNSIKSKKNK